MPNSIKTDLELGIAKILLAKSDEDVKIAGVPLREYIIDLITRFAPRPVSIEGQNTMTPDSLNRAVLQVIANNQPEPEGVES